jgi:hypothetical protein
MAGATYRTRALVAPRPPARVARAGAGAFAGVGFAAARFAAGRAAVGRVTVGSARAAGLDGARFPAAAGAATVAGRRGAALAATVSRAALVRRAGAAFATGRVAVLFARRPPRATFAVVEDSARVSGAELRTVDLGFS